MSAPKPAEPAEGRIDDGGPYNGIDIRGIVDALIQSAFDDGESGVEEYGERVRECRDDLLRAIGRLTTPTAERQASAVRELVAKWRGESNGTDILDCSKSGLMNYCADELEAALADAAPVDWSFFTDPDDWRPIDEATQFHMQNFVNEILPVNWRMAVSHDGEVNFFFGSEPFQVLIDKGGISYFGHLPDGTELRGSDQPNFPHFDALTPAPPVAAEAVAFRRWYPEGGHSQWYDAKIEPAMLEAFRLNDCNIEYAFAHPPAASMDAGEDKGAGSGEETK